LLPGSDDPDQLWRDALRAMPPLKRLVAVLRCDADPGFLAPVPDIPGSYAGRR
jgi:hypothetical protein